MGIIGLNIEDVNLPSGGSISDVGVGVSLLAIAPGATHLLLDVRFPHRKVFWHIIPHNPVEVHRRFKEICCLCLQGG
jgi:hypothetical protein